MMHIFKVITLKTRWMLYTGSKSLNSNSQEY